MKKKVLISIATVAFFGLAIASNLNKKKESDLLVKNIEALAGDEDHLKDEDDSNGDGGGYPYCCDEIWTVEYSGGTDTSVSCTTGGNYKCPICCVS